MMLGSMVGAVSLIMGLGAVSLILKDKVSLQFNLFPMIKNSSDQIPIHMHIHNPIIIIMACSCSDCYACVDICITNTNNYTQMYALTANTHAHTYIKTYAYC